MQLENEHYSHFIFNKNDFYQLSKFLCFEFKINNNLRRFLTGEEQRSRFGVKLVSAVKMNLSVVALNFGLFLLLSVSVWAMPSGRFVLVVTDPRQGPQNGISVIGNAGGAFVSAGRLPWLNIAYSDDSAFAARLMQAGALLVLNHKLAAGCREE